MSEIIDITCEMAQDLFNIGAMGKVKMLTVDELCCECNFYG